MNVMLKVRGTRTQGEHSVRQTLILTNTKLRMCATDCYLLIFCTFVHYWLCIILCTKYSDNKHRSSIYHDNLYFDLIFSTGETDGAIVPCNILHNI